MPAYEYIALDSKGKEEKGILEADNVRLVRQLLRDSQLTPLQVTQVEKSENLGPKKQKAGRVKAGDLALLTRQLATLVQSGSPLEEALSTTTKQTEKRNIKHILSAVRSRVVEGHTLADGFKMFPSVFPDMYRATVAAGEQSGHLDAVLERMADYTETRQETQQRISNAMFYPVILTILSIGIVIGLLMSISAQVVQNLPMRKAVEDAAVKVREGMAINRALEQSSYFPPMTVHLIASGESSGRLDEMLERAAIQQERETDGMMTKMLGIFEPVLILVMGSVVLLIVLSILLPILNLNQLVG